MSSIEDFTCYSVPLMQFLTKEKNLRYLVVGLNQYNNKKFWAFVKDEKLSEALVEWAKGKGK